MHKATISVDSRLGEGSCFKVEFLKGKEHYDEEVEFILDDAEAPVRMGQVVDIANASLQSETLVTAAGPEFEKSSSEEEPLAEDTSKELIGKAGGIAWRCSDTDGFGTAGAVPCCGVRRYRPWRTASDGGRTSSDRNFCRQYRHFLFGCF